VAGLRLEDNLVYSIFEAKFYAGPTFIPNFPEDSCFSPILVLITFLCFVSLVQIKLYLI